jgi:hypothetical protein
VCTQSSIRLHDHHNLYRKQRVDLHLPLGPFTVRVESALGQALAAQPCHPMATGVLNLSLRVPKLATTMCGWMLKMSAGLVTKGKYKRRWVILVDGVLSYYEDPFTLGERKGTLKLSEVSTVRNVGADGKAIKLSHVKGDAECAPWTVAWDEDDSLFIRKMWARKLLRCLPDDVRRNISDVPMLADCAN